MIHKRKFGKLYFKTKNRIFKDTDMRMKIQIINSEKIFINCISDKIVYKVYEELSKLHIK